MAPLVDVFNVGSGVATDVLTIARELQLLLGKTVSIDVSGKFRLGDIRHNVADLTKVQSVFGFKPSISIKEGLRRFVDWVKSEKIQTDRYEESLRESKAKGLLMSVTEKPGLVSVVVASYNHAKFIGKRMESLIHQTYQDMEILVIDDCSSDNSVEVLRRYENHPKVKLVLREKNGGWVTVSNQGIEMSSGEFVILANCDDDCEPRMIERLVAAMKIHPSAGIAFCRSLFVNDRDRLLGDDFAMRQRAFRVRCTSDTLLTGQQDGPLSAAFLCYSKP